MIAAYARWLTQRVLRILCGLGGHHWVTHPECPSMRLCRHCRASSVDVLP